MDETAICLFQGGGRGNIFVSKADPRAFQDVPRGRTREFMTHIAFICDDPHVQAHLPQILVANEHTLRARDMAALQAGLPANVRLLRRKSAWNDAGLCAQTIRWLRDALMPFTDSRQVLLLFDAHRVHTSPRVFAACTACNVWPVLVPAKATWLMQPLDTHAFLAYKIRLQGACQEARLVTPSGEMKLLEVIPCVCRAVHEVLEGRSWAHAFDRDGFSAGQTGVSDRVMTGLQQSAPLDIPHTKPSLDQVKLCFPKRAKVPWSAIWRPVVKAAAKAAEAAPAPGLEPALPAAPRRSLRIAAHGAALHVPHSALAAQRAAATPPRAQLSRRVVVVGAVAFGAAWCGLVLDGMPTGRESCFCGTGCNVEGSGADGDADGSSAEGADDALLHPQARRRVVVFIVFGMPLGSLYS
jgi:hypothetical protein